MSSYSECFVSPLQESNNPEVASHLIVDTGCSDYVNQVHKPTDMFINLVRTVNEKSVRDPKGNLTTIEGIDDVPITIELNDGKIAEFCFIIGYCRYTESREKAREPDGSVVQDPSVVSCARSSSDNASSENDVSDSEKLVQTLPQIVARWRAAQREKMSDSDHPLLSEIAQDFDCCDDTGPNVSEKLAEIMNKRWAEKLDVIVFLFEGKPRNLDKPALWHKECLFAYCKLSEDTHESW